MTLMRATLGHRFLIVWAGQTVSAIGSTLSGVGVAVHVFLETGSAAWLGVLTALAALPYVVTGPFTGLIDRYPRRTVMIAADAAAAVGPVLALAMALTGRLAVWHLAAAAVIAALGDSIQGPAAQTAVPALVPPAALGRANGLVQLGPAVGVVIGPALATPIVAWWGIEAILLIDVVSFLVAVTTTSLVRFDDAAAAAASSVEPVADDGSWRTMWAWLSTTGRPLLVMLAMSMGVNLCTSFFNVASVALATDVAGPARSGLVFAAGGVAMVAGSLVVGSRGIPRRRAMTAGVSLGVAGLGAVVVGAHASLAALIVGTVVLMASIPVLNATGATIYHERVPASMQGRVFGLRSAVARALMPAGSLAAGVVISRVAEPTMADGGIGARWIGPLIGTGAERGSALVVVAVGVAIALIGVWIARSWVAEALDADTADADDAPASALNAGLPVA